MSMATTEQDQKSNGIIKQDQHEKSDSNQLGSGGLQDQKNLSSRDKLRSIVAAYWSSLVITSVYFPIVASGATVCFFLAPQIAFPLLSINSLWYAPVYGFFSASILCLTFAAFRAPFATASGAYMHIYEELLNRYTELSARLNRAGMNEKKYGGPLCQDRKIGKTKSYFPPFQILFVLPLPCCSFVKIHFSRDLVIECLVNALMIIKLEITGQCLARLTW